LENLFLAWDEFRRGKNKRKDVQKFNFNLEDNIFKLHQELKLKIYQHSYYTPFYIQDPKLRRIHKACVRDRVLHQAIFRILYPIFDKSFIYDSYSCRFNQGTHKAVRQLKNFCQKSSHNNHKIIFILKCDIKRFFDSINQNILLKIIKRRIKDNDAIWVIEKIVRSFENEKGAGLPLGNVTSQLFANIYLNELDQFIKRKLKIKYYIRYCDDFAIISKNKKDLGRLIQSISQFLNNQLKLRLHPDKIIIRKYNQGIDFLGYINLPYCCILRTKTKNRIFKRINDKNIQSYLGVLSHCNAHELKNKLIYDILKTWRTRYIYQW
jgi:RNA-directed DNA polymerase